MKNIKISLNNGERILVVDDEADIFAICNESFFADETNCDGDPLDYLESVNGSSIPESDEFRKRIFASIIPDESTLEFDLELEEDQGVSASEETDDTEPVAGFVTVATSGGIRETLVPIIVGRTTVIEAIESEDVQNRSGMTLAQISNQSILLNDDPIDRDFAALKTLQNKDIITLSPKALHAGA